MSGPAPANPTPAVIDAALWLATVDDVPHPIIPRLRERFALSATEACEAARQAADIRRERKTI